MSKELYIAAHEELIGGYLEEHPDATEAEAVEATADAAWDRMIDMLGDLTDQAMQRAKDASPTRFEPTVKRDGDVMI